MTVWHASSLVAARIYRLPTSTIDGCPYKRAEGDFTHKKRSVIRKQRLSDVSRNAGITRSWEGRMDGLIASGRSSSADPLAKAQILSLVSGSRNMREFIYVIANHCVCGNLLL